MSETAGVRAADDGLMQSDECIGGKEGNTGYTITKEVFSFRDGISSSSPYFISDV